MRDYVTRRTVLGASAVAITGTGALAYTQAEPATALQVAGLDVSPASRTLSPNGSVSGVTLSVSLDYEYQASHQPTSVEAACFVAPSEGGSYDELDALTISDPAISDSGTVDLAGDLTDTDAFSADDFDAAEGATNSQDVAVKCVLTIYRDGTRIGLADVSDTAQVTIQREELTVSASIAGSGSLSVATS